MDNCTVSRVSFAFALAALITAGAHAQTTLYTFNGDTAPALFGASVSGAGDVDGDGFADFIVGAAADATNGTDSGSARVFSGADGSILYTFDGDSAGDLFGVMVSGAGDVDGDGIPDLIVGAQGDDNNGTDSGSARVFSGFDGSVLFTLNGDSAGDNFGIAVSGAGDVDGDGFADLIVGAPRDDNNGTDSGSARVVSGVSGPFLVEIDIKPGSFPNSINLVSRGTVPVAIFSTETFDATQVDPTTVRLAGATVRLRGRGTPTASFEDVNGDGRLDIVVHVETGAFDLSEGDTEAVLEGFTFGGIAIRGTDTVRIVP